MHRKLKLKLIMIMKIIKFSYERIDGGEILKSKLPMIITTDLRLNEPRYASLQNIMKAKKKPLTKLKPQDLGIDKIENKLEILKIEEPPIRQAGVKVDNVDQLIEKLKN